MKKEFKKAIEELNKSKDVYDFHCKHDWVKQDKDKTRYLLLEEWQEYQTATTLQDELDACVDYDYIYRGAYLRGQKPTFNKQIEHCINDVFFDVYAQWWGYVQKANMTKGTNGKSVVSNSKIMKGADFKPPEYFAELDGFFDRHPKYKK